MKKRASYSQKSLGLAFSSCLLLLNMMAGMNVPIAQAQVVVAPVYQQTDLKGYVSSRNEQTSEPSSRTHTMALISGQAGPMRNTARLNRGLIRAAQTLIAQLVYHIIAGQAGTILDNGVVRIDRQGQTGDGSVNLQVQIDGLRGASTIAAALVPARYLGLSNPGTDAEVQRVVRQALVFSLNSLINNNPLIYDVEGNPSNGFSHTAPRPLIQQSNRARVTNIKSITNSLLYPITIKNGENTQQTFSVAAGGSWNGNLWVPWVGRDGEMWKSIEISSPDAHLDIDVFQDYWHPGGANAIKWVAHSNHSYNHGQEIRGNNRGGGEKALQILSDGSLRLQ